MVVLLKDDFGGEGRGLKARVYNCRDPYRCDVCTTKGRFSRGRVQKDDFIGEGARTTAWTHRVVISLSE